MGTEEGVKRTGVRGQEAVRSDSSWRAGMTGWVKRQSGGASRGDFTAGPWLVVMRAQCHGEDGGQDGAE